MACGAQAAIAQDPPPQQSSTPEEKPGADQFKATDQKFWRLIQAKLKSGDATEADIADNNYPLPFLFAGGTCSVATAG